VTKPIDGTHISRMTKGLSRRLNSELEQGLETPRKLCMLALLIGYMHVADLREDRALTGGL
jgi:hypothetical protein